ncbi:MAG: ABC transporter ATP-binding protein [Lentisphaerae bacterium]|nr:ABC transporter ATP-binding protein [Lentisphaerota bacterium]
MGDTLIAIRGVTKTYPRGDQVVHALRGVNLDIETGQYISIMGPSGSGKSTLFNMIGGLDMPTEGEVRVDGCRLAALDSDQLAWFRCHKIGFIFQSFNLVNTMTAQENVAIARTFAGVSYAEAMADAAQVLTRVGLEHRLTHLPSQVSGGQQQRIAIARALVNRPMIILADEPTGNLDLKTGQDIIDLLYEMKTVFGITVVTATHDMKMISASDRLVKLRSGAVEEMMTRAEMNVSIGTIDGESVA